MGGTAFYGNKNSFPTKDISLNTNANTLNIGFKGPDRTQDENDPLIGT